MIKESDARAKRSQDALLRAGLELLIENGEASLSEIAAHAGVGRATLYRQYETREHLIAAIAVRCLQAFDEATESIEHEAVSVMDAIRMMFDRLMPMTMEFQFLISLEQIAAGSPEMVEITRKQKQEMVDLIELGKRSGEISRTLTTSWIVNYLDGLFYAGWAQQKETGDPPEKVAGYAFTSFSWGVSPSP